MRILLIVIFILIANLANASEKYLSEDIISGTAIKKITQKGNMYLSLKTTAGNIWVYSPDMKIVIGKSYKFYPPYFIENNIKLDGKKYTFDKVLSSIGPINSKYIDVTPYSFKGITIGSPINEVYENLRGHNYDVVYLPNTLSDKKLPKQIRVKNMDFGNDKVDVDFSGDFDDKLTGYFITKSSEFNSIDNAWISINLDFLSNVFKEKYGKPNSCNPLDNISKYNSIQHCEWEFGDIMIRTYYYYKEGRGSINGSVVSTTRNLKLMNALQRSIDETNKKYDEELKKLDDDMKNNIKSITKKAADSF